MHSAPSLYELFESAAREYGQNTALTLIQGFAPITDSKLSCAELFAGINQTVRLLRRISGKQKPVVAILMPSTFDTQFLLWGASCAGIACPINPLLNEAALAALMNTAKVDAIAALGPVPTSDIWQKVQNTLPLLERQVPVISCMTAAGEYFFSEQLSQSSATPLTVAERPKKDDIAAYFHTGGTTGAPKLACHSHANQLAAAAAFMQNMQLGVGDSILNGLPMFHVAGSLATALGSIASGVNMVIPTPAGLRNPLVIQHHWQIVEHYQLTVTGGIPTSVAAMLEQPIAQANIASIRYFISGGAPIPAALCERVKAITGKSLYQIYGMTECTGVITMPNLSKPSIPGSAGFVSGAIEVKADSRGELMVKGPTVFQGYLGLRESGIVDGWLKTGDLGHLDAEGNLFITGRAKDVIIRGGHNIDPALIEDCLETHPEVIMAAAVGMPDEYAGELPVAFVQLKQGATVTAQTLCEYAKERVAERPAAPKQIFIIEALPITSVGKIFKVKLRELAAQAAINERLPQAQVHCSYDASGQLVAHFNDAHNAQACLDITKGLNLACTFS